MQTDTHKALCKLLKGDYRNESSIQLVKRVEGLVIALRRERDDAVSELNDALELVSGAAKQKVNDLSRLSELLAAQPQLNEIRYVLHGDIQPCTVLYSDDTTTLLRLDEGDIMCETDTIEWSDSVTYRCQELLRGFVGLTASAKFTHHTLHAASPVLAQLVRDERILLNDDALEPGTEWTDNNSPTPIR